jgi:hypothetical protein
MPKPSAISLALASISALVNLALNLSQMHPFIAEASTSVNLSSMVAAVNLPTAQ